MRNGISTQISFIVTRPSNIVRSVIDRRGRNDRVTMSFGDQLAGGNQRGRRDPLIGTLSRDNENVITVVVIDPVPTDRGVRRLTVSSIVPIVSS